MNQDEHDKLDEIHQDVRETRTQTQVIEERTSALDSRIDKIQGQTMKNAEDIDDLQSTVSRNSTILGGVATGVSAVVLWLSDKLTRLI